MLINSSFDFSQSQLETMDDDGVKLSRQEKPSQIMSEDDEQEGSDLSLESRPLPSGVALLSSIDPFASQHGLLDDNEEKHDESEGDIDSQKQESKVVMDRTKHTNDLKAMAKQKEKRKVQSSSEDSEDDRSSGEYRRRGAEDANRPTVRGDVQLKEGKSKKAKKKLTPVGSVNNKFKWGNAKEKSLLLSRPTVELAGEEEQSDSSIKDTIEDIDLEEDSSRHGTHP